MAATGGGAKGGGAAGGGGKGKIINIFSVSFWI